MTSPKPLTAEEMAQIRARAEAATPGPWDLDAAGGHGHRWGVTGPESEDFEFLFYPADYPRHGVDAEFIAHARSDVPRLLEEVERLRAALVRAREDLHDEFCGYSGPALEKHLEPCANATRAIGIDVQPEIYGKLP